MKNSTVTVHDIKFTVKHYCNQCDQHCCKENPICSSWKICPNVKFEPELRITQGRLFDVCSTVTTLKPLKFRETPGGEK